MADIFQSVFLLSFLMQTADQVHRSDTSMHPGGFILAETIKPNHIEVALAPSIVSANRKFFLAITLSKNLDNVIYPRLNIIREDFQYSA